MARRRRAAPPRGRGTSLFERLALLALALILVLAATAPERARTLKFTATGPAAGEPPPAALAAALRQEGESPLAVAAWPGRAAFEELSIAGLPGNVFHVFFRRHHPIARIAGGPPALLSRTGVRYPQRGEPPPGLPPASGLAAPDLEAGVLRETAALLNMCAQKGFAVTRLALDPYRGFTVYLPRSELVFGWGPFDEAFARLDRIQRRQKLARMKRIEIDYREKAFVLFHPPEERP